MNIQSGQVYRHRFEGWEIKITKEGRSFVGTKTWDFEVVKPSDRWAVGMVKNFLESTLKEFFVLVENNLQASV